MCLMLTMSPAKERRSHGLTLPFVIRRNEDEGAELIQWGAPLPRRSGRSLSAKGAPLAPLALP